MLAFCGYDGGGGGIKGREPVGRNEVSAKGPARCLRGDELDPDKGPIVGPIYF
jgi:hypothetical protein